MVTSRRQLFSTGLSTISVDCFEEQLIDDLLTRRRTANEMPNILKGETARLPPKGTTIKFGLFQAVCVCVL